jgi:Trp operon repressor
VRSSIFRFKTEVEKLEEEKDRIYKLLKQTQAQYLEKGMLDTRIYNNKMKSFTARLTVVEERLAFIEAQQALKKGA